jgi:imidazole glycerol-phosphate synthase subunit HisF
VLKKRLIGVITVRDGWAVQSFGYSRYLPLGRPECIAENLDRWGVDEIVVLCIDRSRKGLGPDLALVRRLGELGLSTPLTYGGGVRASEDATAVIQSGADRLCVDALLRRNPETVRQIATLVGAQAVIGVLPLSLEKGVLCVRDHVAGTVQPLTTQDLSLFGDRVVSEALIVDWRNEGRADSFDTRLVAGFPLQGVPVIAFGGISEPKQLSLLLSDEKVVAAAVGNFLAYREHAVQQLKGALGDSPIRPATFAADR